MRDWQTSLLERLETGRPTVMVTCIEVLGSAPCTQGSRMLIDAHTSIGTVGGGNLEFVAIEQARKLLKTPNRCLVQSLPLGPILAQCCGGRVRLLYERFSQSDVDFIAAVARSKGVLVTRCEASAYGKWLRTEDTTLALEASTAPQYGAIAQSGTFDGTYWQEDAHFNLPQVCIFGAGHVGLALARILQEAPCQTLLIDPREETKHNLPIGVNWVQTDDPDTARTWWQAGSIAIVLTHSHELDFAWISHLLSEQDTGYCGLIGSKTKRARFVRRLRSDGLSEEQIGQLTCPIGLPGLNSKNPGAVAISTAAQVLPLLEAPRQTPQAAGCGCVPVEKTFPQD